MQKYEIKFDLCLDSLILKQQTVTNVLEQHKYILEELEIKMKFKMKSITSILVAAAMLATMAVPVSASISDTEFFVIDTVHEEQRSMQKETFTFEDETVTKIVNYVPAGEKVTITAKKDGLSFYSYAEWDRTYVLFKNDSFAPSDHEMKVGESLSFTVEESVGYQRYLIELVGRDTAWELYFNTGTPGAAATETPSETTDKAPADEAPADKAPATDAPVATPYEGGESYVVKAGDTLGLLSLNNYGSYDYWGELYKLNAAVLKKSGGKIYEGLNIILPQTIAKNVNRIAPQEAYEGEKLYTVKSGDTLGTIALAQYKDMSKYKAIFERNSDRLKNANTIYTGQVIVLPQTSSKVKKHPDNVICYRGIYFKSKKVQIQ